MSSKASSRLAAGALAASALALFGLTFAPWFAHEELKGPRGRFIDTETLSGWEVNDDVAALVLLAVFAGLGAAVWSARRPRDPRLPAACCVACFTAIVAAVWIAQEVRAPSDITYNDLRSGAPLALRAAITLAAASLLAAVGSLVARWKGKGRSDRSTGPVWPAVAGAGALYLLGYTVNETEVWQPEALAVCCAAGVGGYFVARWWLVLVPVPVLLAGIGQDTLGGFVLAFLALFVARRPRGRYCDAQASASRGRSAAGVGAGRSIALDRLR